MLRVLWRRFLRRASSLAFKNGIATSRIPKTRRLDRLEELETRLAPALFSVSAQFEIARVEEPGDILAASLAPAAPARGVVFFESNVRDFQILAHGLAAGTDAVLLDNAADGLRAMAAFLAGRHDLAAIGVVAHGAPGSMQLGSVALGADRLDDETPELAAVTAALSAGGELDLWSCDVAAGPAGEALLHGLTARGARVAAADHPIGAAPRGADWNLNVRAEGAHGTAPFSSAALSAYPDVLGAWSTTGSLATKREYDTATVLASGKVLVVGGQGDSGYLGSAELYDAGTNTWFPAASMAVPRFLHTATLLKNGMVLVVGGFGNTGYLASAELYDPASNTWSSAGSLAAARDLHTATLLPSGKVLVSGGYNAGVIASAEIYDPGTNTWSPAGSMATARDSHTATLLGNGKVLVTGGIDNGFGSLASAEIYDPATNSWAPAAAMTSPRYLHTATVVPNRDVLVVGGVGNNFDAQASAELYDFVNNVWLSAGFMATPRDQHTATPLASGKVLVTGGQSTTYLASAEIYDSATNTWSATDSMATARANHTASLLSSGQVLIAGGEGTAGRLASSELFTYINPTATTRFVVTPVSGNSLVAGSPFLFTVQAVDQFGNPVGAYSGPTSVTVTAIPTDPLANLPLTGTLSSSGFAFFQGNLKCAGTYTLTASAGAIAGASSNLTVSPATAVYFSVTAPASVDAGAAFDCTVKALDQFGNVSTGYQGKVHFTSSSGASLPADVTLTAGVGVFSMTLNSAGSQTIAATDAVSASPITMAGVSGPIVARGLVVTAFTPTPTGFTVTFNKPFVPANLTLYGGSSTIQDVTVVGAANGSINGTLLLAAPYTSATFKATAVPLDFINTVVAGGVDSVVLPDDAYTVTLVSGTGSNGFLDALGAGLDGAASGGHSNYTTTFTTHYQANATPVLALPDFARGPDSSAIIKVPNNTASGIPVTLYNAVNLTDAAFTLTFNSSLLNVAGAGSVDATGAGSTLTLAGSTSTTATFSYHSAVPQSGNIVLGDIIATVPNSAKTSYKMKELLQLSAVTVNGTPFTGVTAPGVHMNVYFGDVSGNGLINAGDVNPMFLVSIGMNSGFVAHTLIDPVVVGDVAGDVSVDGGDVATLKSYLLHLPRPVIPTPPGLTGFVSAGAPDPTLDLRMKDEGGRMNPSSDSTDPSSFSLQPSVEITIDHPHPDGSTGLTEAILALTYDPTVLSVAPSDITLGSIAELGGAWQLRAVVDAQTGQIGIEMTSSAPISSNDPRSLIDINFHLSPFTLHPSLFPTVRLVDKATPDGETFVTALADTQGSLVTTIGVAGAEIQTGRAANKEPPLNSDVSGVRIGIALDAQRSESMAFTEKRAAERFPISGNVTCDFASPVLEDFGAVRVKNISTTGIGLLVPEQLQPDMLLAVKLVNSAKKFTKTALVRVVHVTQQSASSWLVGGNLDTPLTYEELCALVMA